MNWIFVLCWLGLAGKPADPNVIILTIDTLRADRLGCYGYSRATSPALDVLSRESVLFEALYAQSSFTPPSHASILTSLYVRQHGVLTWNTLAEEHETLAEVLRQAGYTTGAIVHLQMLSKNNLGQGFEMRDEASGMARVVTQRALGWMETHRERKFFLWLHYYDVHSPYGNHPEYERKFNSTHDPRVGRRMKHYNVNPEARRELGMTPDDVEFMKDRYDGGVAYCDSALGELVAGLKKMGIWSKTLLVVTSDHGESLDEHEQMYFAHDPFLYDPVTRIPGVIHFPNERYAGLRVKDFVESIDLAPTILSYLGIAVPERFEGRNLLGIIEGEQKGRREVFSECWGWALRKSIRTDRWKLIWNVKTDKRGLFDLRSDPTEQTDVADKFPEVVDRLYKQLLQWAGGEANPIQQNPELDEETLRRIRTLGYAGGE